MKELIEKANILIEALPYIRTFYGKTFVIKYGGAAMTEDSLKNAFAQDIVLLSFIGIRPIIVHGGGQKISSAMEKMGKKPMFVHGQRITDKETMNIVEMVLGGLINKEIVNLINTNGGRAVGLSGKDAGLITAKKKTIKKPSAKAVDLGLVGKVEKVEPLILENLQAGNFIPVIAPIGVSRKGETLNINADLVASSIASAIRAEKLIFLTDTQGIMDKKGVVIGTLDKKKIERLTKDGVISGGMMPKVESCLDALMAGVSKTHIIDGRIPHSLLIEIFTDKGIGTEIIRL